MKCRVCSTEIPQGKKCCPKCGRVVTAADTQSAPDTSDNYSPVTDSTIVYRPASSTSNQPTDKTISITDIFSSDPNAPVYSDPHTYDKATADALEYDRMFMSRSKQPDEDVKVFEPENDDEQEKKTTDFTIEQEYDYDEDADDFDEEYDDFEEEAPSRGNVIRDKKKGKPHFNFNIKYLILAVAVIAGLAVIIYGINQLGKQFGIFGGETVDEPQSGISSGVVEKPTKNNEASSDVAADNEYTEKPGVYTVYTDQNNIFVYKSVTDQRIIATIPNKTILEISEIEDDFGKTTYNNYTGWVKLSELKFTPNESPEKVTEKETEKSTEKETEKETEKATEQANETTTALPSYKPGTYTVDLKGSSQKLNVRSSGSTEGEIINSISEGTQVTVEEVKSSWGKIYIDGIEGWVYMEYLK